MINKIIRNFLAKLAAGRTDDGIMITLPDPKKIDFQEAMMQDLLMRNGIDPNAITSEEMLKGILNQIDMASKQTASSGIRGTRSAKVLDMEGQTIPPGSQIMGGKAVDTDVDTIVNNIKSMEPITAMKEANSVIARKGKYKNLTPEQSKKILQDTEDHIFERDVKPSEFDPDIEDFAIGGRVGLKGGLTPSDYLKVKDMLNHYHDYRKGGGKKLSKAAFARAFFRENNADGGRIGLKDGMNRRTFLKLLGGLASIPIVGKIIKPLKTVKGVKNVPIIKTDNVPGKPEWFDALVNKVIIEGDDVSKNLATKDREIVHVKKIDDNNEVTVYQDLETDSIRVEYNSPDNMFGEPVDLDFRRTLPDEGAPKGSAEFEVTESGIVGRQTGPDDFGLEVEGVGGSSISDIASDVSKLKEYATGQKQTLKEFVQSKKRKDKVKKINENDPDEVNQYVTDRQGDYDPSYEDYASGGIAGMLGE